MILCVWTAVHLNIPDHNKANAQMWRKLGWMITALFAPEYVTCITSWYTGRMLTQNKLVFIAYCQHVQGIEIGKVMRMALNQSEPLGLVKKLLILLKGILPSLSNALSKPGMTTESLGQTEQLSQHIEAKLGVKTERYLWTHAHSLYATMGGLVIDTRDMGCDYLPDGRKRMTLTLMGLEFVANHDPDLLPDLSSSAINDKSKANVFVKTITGIQALWFGIQCISRSAQGLSISLLEMNTAIHAACALALYFFFWRDKPLDVEEPTICTHPGLHHIAALEAVSKLYPNVQLSLVDLQNTEDNEIPDSSADSETAVFHPTVQHILLRPSKDPKLQSENCLVYHGFVFRENMKLWPNGTTYKQLTELDFDRFKLASQAVRKYELTLDDLDYCFDEHWYDHPNKMFVAKWKIYFVIGFVLANLLYGGVHLTVWNRPFRGKTDGLLWKLSSIKILVSPILGGILYYWSSLHSDDDGSGRPPTRSATWTLAKKTSRFVLLVILCMSGFLYIFARVFIVAECFLHVFHLTDSAFEVPRWSQYFPYIG